MSFRTFDLSHDVASIVSAINEVVTLKSSLYLPMFMTSSSLDANMKFFNNIASGSVAATLGGYWETIYDSSPASSLSTALLDMTFGYTTSSIYYQNATARAYASSSYQEKLKVYQEISNVLQGDASKPFTINGSQVNEAFFILKLYNLHHSRQELVG